METLDRPEAPGLALLPLGLRPDDGWPVRRQDETRPGIGDLDAVAARLVDVQEERLLDRVLVGTGLDVNAVLQEDIGRPQHVFAAVHGIGDMVKASARAVV